MKRFIVATGLLIAACKGDASKRTAETAAASKDAGTVDGSSAPDAAPGANDPDFDKLMRELDEMAQVLIPILSRDEKDCGIVASHIAQVLSQHANAMVQAQEMPDFRARSNAWYARNPVDPSLRIEGDPACLHDERVKKVLVIAFPGMADDL